MFFRPRTTRIPFRENGQKPKTAQRLQRIELDLLADRHAHAAVEAYADSCAVDMPWLAELLRESATRNAGELSACAATIRRVFGVAQQWAAEQPDYAHGAWEHVRLHLDAALNCQSKPQDDEPNGSADEVYRLGPAGTN